MQVRLLLKSQNNICLDLSYHHIVQSFIYNLLSPHPDFSDFLHDKGYEVNNRKYKGFVFGQLTGDYSISGKTISFGREVSLIIRSPKVDFINAIIYAASQNHVYNLATNTITIKSASIEPMPKFSNHMYIKMLSPLTIHTTDIKDGRPFTHYLSPNDLQWNEKIYENSQRKYTALTGNKSVIDFNISTDKNCNYKKYVTKFKSSIYITAWYGNFYLSGDTNILEFLYNTGLGSNNSQGFGLFDILQY